MHFENIKAKFSNTGKSITICLKYNNISYSLNFELNKKSDLASQTITNFKLERSQRAKFIEYIEACLAAEEARKPPNLDYQKYTLNYEFLPSDVKIIDRQTLSYDFRVIFENKTQYIKSNNEPDNPQHRWNVVSFYGNLPPVDKFLKLEFYKKNIKFIFDPQSALTQETFEQEFNKFYNLTEEGIKIAYIDNLTIIEQCYLYELEYKYTNYVCVVNNFVELFDSGGGGLYAVPNFERNANDYYDIYDCHAFHKLGEIREVKYFFENIRAK